MKLSFKTTDKEKRNKSFTEWKLKFLGDFFIREKNIKKTQ